MQYRINQPVGTPLGTGLFMANYAIQKDEALVVIGRMVQVKLTDANRDHIKDTNCLTPFGNTQALFVFQDSELSPM